MSIKIAKTHFLSLGALLLCVACGSDPQSKIQQSISVPRGVQYQCTRYETVSYGKLDPAFCLFDELGVPGQRLYKRYEGYDCLKVTYNNDGNVVSRSTESYHAFGEEATQECSTQTLRKNQAEKDHLKNTDETNQDAQPQR